MMLEAHEILPNHILPLEISGAEQHRRRPLAFFRPSLPPYPLTPRRLSGFWPSPVRRAKKQIPRPMQRVAARKNGQYTYSP